ncbi:MULTISPECIES: DUF6088 family protein [unclassified Wenzhouxiangella]|uniref:DUF6088 family protein n=1 Tax=unclassified Wenzhouxiangella TaxID=2613841 RepID=UPI000E32CB24|nr:MULTISPECIES: DUF6088 family protein [unclassified Wenzhouxiangella]RFF27662.1 hypothetical protein DZK25_06495 [Wenzhouxiangella sp. 15181]RFP69754.1 hypothetical protein DZK26_02390 [Wenzhouxiangella sp. 15190]
MTCRTLKSRIRYRVSRSRQDVFLVRDFLDLSDRDQVGRVLRELIGEGRLIRIGQGLYARARRSSVSGRVIPVKDLPRLADEALRRLGLTPTPSSLERRYNRSETTQVPTGRYIGVRERVSRKIGYDGKYMTVERAA